MVSLTPAQIVQADRECAASLNDVQYENQQVANSILPPKKDKSTSNSKAEGIKLKGGVMLATKCDFAKISDDNICYANELCFRFMILLARRLLLSLTFCRSMRIFSS